MYMESLDQGRRFFDLCRDCPKPIVLLKGGKSKKGAAAAMSHTASLAGNNALIRGVMEQAGVVEASGFKQMADLARTLARYPKGYEKGKARIAVLTYSGGAGIVSADFIEKMGLEAAELSRGTLHQLKSVSPSWMPVSNPVDLWPAVERNGARKAFGTAMRAVCSDPGVDGVLLHAFSGGFALNTDITEMVRITKAAKKPLFVWLLGERDAVREFQENAQDSGVPVFRELSRAVECMAAVFKMPQPPVEIKVSAPDSIPLLSDFAESILEAGKGTLDEYVSKKILAGFNIPTVEEKIATDLPEAIEFAVKIGFPVVMKGLISGKLHKTEEGLVYLWLQSEKDVEQAYLFLTQKMGEKGGKILVQRQVTGGIEIIAGLVRDSQFGPCVMCGIGGTMAEILNDSVFAAAPLSKTDAMSLISRLKNQKLLEGFRGQPEVDKDELARILTELGRLGVNYDRIMEIDVNPLIACEKGLLVVDSSIVLVG
jgi:acetyltransferase